MKGIVCIACVLLFVNIVIGQYGNDICGPNSYTVPCKSCCPEATCQMRFPGRCGGCPPGCNRGCYCNPGFIKRSTNGPCIPLDKC
uniref:Cysteine-rich venom protein 6-like isoform X1 n=2 Tax=Diabrotica virgifera virgifera TaxID=50390 RepID=A0A6P7FK26_DIAVI